MRPPMPVASVMQFALDHDLTIKPLGRRGGFVGGPLTPSSWGFAIYRESELLGSVWAGGTASAPAFSLERAGQPITYSASVPDLLRLAMEAPCT